MSSSLTNAPLGAHPFVCEHRLASYEACRDEPFYKKVSGNDKDKDYCVLHYPGADKSAGFALALTRKLAAGNFNFRYVWFPDKLLFGNVTFGQEVDFSYTTFNAGADFKDSKFAGDAYFQYAEFKGDADFRFARFERLAYFRGADFTAAANFQVVAFVGETEFTAVKFRGPADFSYTRITDYITFSGEDAPAFDSAAFLDFQFANIEKPERISFRTLRLRPHWLVNVDARKFDLSNVDWNWHGISLRQELGELHTKGVATPHRVLSIACRNLALNAEENHRYDEASTFRFWAMDARRRERAGGFRPWTLGWWYWFASSYGESIPKAIAVFVGIWLGFAFLYYSSPHYRCVPNTSDCGNCIGWVSPETCTRGCADADATRECRPFNSFMFSVVYTVETMTLQKPDPRPKTPPARIFVLLCTILGPLQAALLGLAVRRRFMR